jgi:hypothetical protein
LTPKPSYFLSAALASPAFLEIPLLEFIAHLKGKKKKYVLNGSRK